MTFVERSGERLTRVIDRRKFLKRATAIAFGVATASAAALFRPATARAVSCPYGNIDPICTCDFGLIGLCSGSCPSGGGCPSGCSIAQSHFVNGHAQGCWCTDICCAGENGTGNNGYWTCCDCTCGGNPCSCGAFHTTSFC